MRVVGSASSSWRRFSWHSGKGTMAGAARKPGLSGVFSDDGQFVMRLSRSCITSRPAHHTGHVCQHSATVYTHPQMTQRLCLGSPLCEPLHSLRVQPDPPTPRALFDTTGPCSHIDSMCTPALKPVPNPHLQSTPPDFCCSRAQEMWSETGHRLTQPNTSHKLETSTLTSPTPPHLTP